MSTGNERIAEDERLPYAGLRVLDLSQGVAVPYCGALLSLQGAAVVKVEPPAGDWIRTVGAGREGMSSCAVVCNSGKRGLAIDATKPRARDILLDLAARADVVLQNYRPGVVERMGLGYEAVRARNPEVVYLSLTGFGPRGPDAAKPATDAIVQGYTGMAMMNRDDDGTPRRVGMLVIDLVSGLYSMQAVGAALYRRARTGRGRHVRLSLLEAASAFQAYKVLDEVLFASGAAPPPLTAPSGMFRASDGFFNMTCINDRQFAAIAQVMQRPDWTGDARFATVAARLANVEAINAEVAAVIATREKSHWLARLTQADVLCGPIADYRDLLAAEQVGEMQVFGEIDQPPYGTIRLPRLPGYDASMQPRASPRAGEHSRAVLREAGLADGEIERLISEGVVLARD